ncbi:glycine cleavage system protein H, partial [Staphylococcus pseudintermedius]|uniref:glycine cleavage system protein H n=1 Tax=Staphylococcus pseudintermedius TaxID=283734 RepID=UPI000D839C7B
MNTPENLFYTQSDEWLRLESAGTLTLGITDYAQSELGELVYVEVTPVGQHVSAGGTFG